MGVREDRVLFVTVIAASQGIHTLASKYPAMKIITSEVDAGLNEGNRVVPGVGEFGDRYFGHGSRGERGFRGGELGDEFRVIFLGDEFRGTISGDVV